LYDYFFLDMGQLLNSTGYYAIFHMKFLPFEEEAADRLWKIFEIRMSKSKEFEDYSWSKNKSTHGLVIRIHSPVTITIDIYHKSDLLRKFVSLLTKNLTFKPQVMFFDKDQNNCINLDYFAKKISI